MHNFPDCISHVLAAEGGLVNDPKDPGGVTKFGISQRSLSRPQHPRPVPGRRQSHLPARLLGTDPGRGPPRGPRPPGPGPRRQRRPGPRRPPPAAPGRSHPRMAVMGPVTLAGVAVADPDDLIARYSELRLDFYRDLPTWRALRRRLVPSRPPHPPRRPGHGPCPGAPGGMISRRSLLRMFGHGSAGASCPPAPTWPLFNLPEHPA